MLSWVGKRQLRGIISLPAQHIEMFSPISVSEEGISNAWKDWPSEYPKGGILFHGDNKEVLSHLLANGFRGSIKLVYIDPPFDSGADYVRKVQLRGVKGSSKFEGENYSLGEQIQYTDIWANDNYLQFMYERLILIRELLSEDGSIVLHADSGKCHLLRCLLDEVFSADNFRNEITWHYVKYQMGQIKQFVDNTEKLIWYSKGQNWTYNLQYEILDTPKSLLAKGWDKDKGVIVNLRDQNGKTYKITINEEKIDNFWDLHWNGAFDAVNSEGKKITISQIPADSAWLLPYVAAPSHERTGFPTQKPEILLTRLIKCLSNPGESILDCFIGSGTTGAVAQRLGCRWIGCDINKTAIQTTSKRIQSIIKQQIDDLNTPQQTNLHNDEKVNTNKPKPAQFQFSVWRINDYDLQIQHNEAVNLACEYIGW